MKIAHLALVFAALLAPLQAAKPPAPAVPADPGWPREIVREGTKLIYHQPQIDEWKNYRQLKARIAFSLTPKNGQPAVGIAELEGNTVANLEARTVFIEKLKIGSARFPSLKEEESATMEAFLKKTFPGKAITVSLDRLIAGVERSKETFTPVEVKMDPPPIFTSTQPAALLIVEGEPVRVPLGETGLEFVVNTNWDLFFEPEAQRYFLLNDKAWLTAEALDGAWTLAAKVPAALAKAPKDWDHLKKALPAKVTKGMKVPRVIYADKPAELIVFEGTPVFEKVAGTRLLWAKNTESWVFQNSEDSQTYFLVSGRWFRAPKLEGPWTYAGNDLPEDFKLIPPTHACADVLASVPGTPEAEDAILLAQIPVEARIKRSEAEAKVKVAYDGEPQFEEIKGAAVSYAKNTSADVIKVENKYYLCQDAVWFVAGAPIGPWKIVTVVPPAIYTIPPAYPVHRVTYVKVEADDDDYVVSSYTAGYYGAYVAGVATTAALVYGSGFYHPPYIFRGAVPIYRPFATTYGVAAAYNPWTGGYAVGQRYYGPYANAGRAAYYNPVTGGYGRAATVQTAYGGRTVAAGYNPRTDTAWSTRQGNNGYAQWGTTAVSRGDDFVRAGHIATEEGGVARWKGSEGGGKIKWEDGEAKGVARHDDNLYAGKDGNVYRRDDDGNWAKYDDGGWDDVDRPDRNNASSQSASGQRGQGQQKPPAGKPPTGQKPPTGKPPTGQPPQRPGGAERPQGGNRATTLPSGDLPPRVADRPSTLPADRQRPQNGERPSTMPAERQRPQAAQRPSTMPAERQRPQAAQRPSTMPAERQRPQNFDRASIEQRPSTRPAAAQPSVATMGGLDRESASRSRGSAQASRQQSFDRSAGASYSSRAGGASRGGGSRGGGGGGRGGGGRGR